MKIIPTSLSKLEIALDRHGDELFGMPTNTSKCPLHGQQVLAQLDCIINFQFKPTVVEPKEVNRVSLHALVLE